MFYNNDYFVFYSSYEDINLNNLGECCNHVNIQSDGPASVHKLSILGDYEKNGNDSNVYRNVMGSGEFLFKDSDGQWMVCTNCQCSLF